MCRVVVKLVAPAAFLAMQVYSPMCDARTDSMVSALTFLLFLLIIISSLFSSSVPLKSHEILIGVSPLVTVHWTDPTSPALIDSSPNEKGMIWGSTEKYFKDNIDENLIFYNAEAMIKKGGSRGEKIHS
jgi:hypothetical protein